MPPTGRKGPAHELPCRTFPDAWRSIETFTEGILGVSLRGEGNVSNRTFRGYRVTRRTGSVAETLSAVCHLVNGYLSFR